jgi:hypothetical protein
MILADELLLLTLSPSEPRNTGAHDGIRAAVCGADVLDLWLAGAPLPGNVRRHIRSYNFRALDPALARLAVGGQIASRPARGLGAALGAQVETLVNVNAAAAIRARLQASLAGSQAPPVRDAALAVLLYQARLWNWAGLEAYSLEDVRVFGRRRPAATPLKRHAQALAEGKAVLPQDPAGFLVQIGKAIDHEYVHYSD